ncbi:MAG: hypothetical protein ACTSR2_00370 [Candidatus Hodarchaeales archaeon]
MEMNIFRLLFFCGQPLEDQLSFFASIRQPEKFSVTKYKLNILRFEDVFSLTPTSIFFAPQALQRTPVLGTSEDTMAFDSPSVIGEWQYV